MQSQKKSLLVVLAAVVLSVLSIVPAQAQSEGVKADIPFDFVLGNKTLKAGTYRVQTQGSFLAVVSETGNTRFVLALADDKAPDYARQPHLQFLRYGDESFLSKVVFEDKASYVLPRSSREKEVIAKANQGEPADVDALPAGSR